MTKEILENGSENPEIKQQVAKILDRGNSDELETILENIEPVKELNGFVLDLITTASQSNIITNNVEKVQKNAKKTNALPAFVENLLLSQETVENLPIRDLLENEGQLKNGPAVVANNENKELGQAILRNVEKKVADVKVQSLVDSGQSPNTVFQSYFTDNCQDFFNFTGFSKNVVCFSFFSVF